ncbi:sensor histidine kinase [Micromonospora sp. NPDC047074]|uniref:sensor histidine kinase n=1 Tax=Micromonospora sp. NPDC047074 TaxID=3154339 RepID=UPI0034017C4F
MRFWRWALIAFDLPAAAAVMAAVVLLRPVSGWWVWCLAALLGLPLAVRRRWPVPVLVVVVLAAAAALVVGIGGEVAVYAVAFALYPVALSSARAAAVGLAGALAGILVPGVLDAVTARLPVVAPRAGAESFSTAPVTVTAYSAAVVAGTWALAWALRTRRQHAAQLAALHTARAVAEERLRIARDVHDAVGHSLSLITMRAAVANHLGAEREAALRMIEQVGREALDDVRTVLGGLRERGSPGDGDALSGTDLDGLVERTRAAGVDVTIERGDLSSVPAGVRASAYRILQEALTNVRRHARRATRCQVVVAVAPDALTLTVTDDGAVSGDAGRPGHGLLGMRERIAGHGGSLSAGPGPAGGFAVRATLPFPT